MYNLLIGKLNTELHELAIGVGSRNGFELYRQVARKIDAVPENQKYLLGAELVDMAKKYGDKVRDLKSLYGFRLLLKKRAALYKKAVGEEVDKEKLEEIIWNVMDTDSKLLATRMGLASKGFDEIAAHIDQRYQITMDMSSRAQRMTRWASLHSSNKSAQNRLQRIRRTQVKNSNRTLTINI